MVYRRRYAKKSRTSYRKRSYKKAMFKRRTSGFQKSLTKHDGGHKEKIIQCGNLIRGTTDFPLIIPWETNQGLFSGDRYAAYRATTQWT